MNVARIPTVDKRRESAYGQKENQIVRLVAERAKAIATLEHVLALLGTRVNARDYFEAGHVVREVLAELKALDPSSLGDETEASVTNNHLKALRNVLSQSSKRISGVFPLKH